MKFGILARYKGVSRKKGERIVKKAFITLILFSSTTVFGTASFPLDINQQRKEIKMIQQRKEVKTDVNQQRKDQKMKISENFLNQNICGMNFDEALKKGDSFAKEYLYAWGASVSFTRQDRDANLRVLCERIGSFLLITALKHESYDIVKFLKDHGADADKILCCMMPGLLEIKI